MDLSEPLVGSGGETRNETRRLANARAILEAADRLVEHRGSDFTTQELIKEAGVALQTFYRHYAGKDQLLLAVIADRINGFCRSLEEEAAGFDDPVERLHLFVSASVAGLGPPGAGPPGEGPQGGGPQFITSQHWRLHQLFPEEVTAATMPVADLVRRTLEDGQASGAFTVRDPERDAWLIVRMVMSVFHHYAFARADAGLDTAADDLWRFCLAAVGGTDPLRHRGRALRRR